MLATSYVRSPLSVVKKKALAVFDFSEQVTTSLAYLSSTTILGYT